MIRALPFVVVLILSIFCLIEAISSRDDQIRNLPKIVWILLILFFPFVGSVAWLAAGRPVYAAPTRMEREFPEYERPGRQRAADPEADEAFLRQVRERAEEQRRKAAELKRIEAERLAKLEQEKQDPEQP